MPETTQARPPFRDFLTRARDLNPGYSDSEHTDKYLERYGQPDPAEIPTVEQFVESATELNPDYSVEEHRARYAETYGKFQPQEPPSFLSRAATTVGEWVGKEFEGLSPGQALTQASRSFMQGAMHMGGEGLKGIGIAAEELDQMVPEALQTPGTAQEHLTYRMGERINQLAQDLFPADPKLQERFIVSVVPRALGSMATFALGGYGAAAVTGTTAGAAGAAGSLGALVQGAQSWQEATAKGATPENISRSFWAGAAVGTSEAIPIERMLSRFDKLTGGRFRNAIQQGGMTAIQEFLQEWGQEVGANAVAKAFYDDQRELFENAGVSGSAGGVSGFILGLAHGGFRKGRVQRWAQPVESEEGPESVAGKLGVGDPNVGLDEAIASSKEMAEGPQITTESLDAAIAAQEGPRRLLPGQAAVEEAFVRAQETISKAQQYAESKAQTYSEGKAGRAREVLPTAQEAAQERLRAREAEVAAPLPRPGQPIPELAGPETQEPEPAIQVVTPPKAKALPEPTPRERLRAEREKLLAMRRPTPTPEPEAPPPVEVRDRRRILEEQAPAARTIDEAAQEAATSPLSPIPEPTKPQIEAGVYKKGHVRISGLDLSIENPEGSERSGVDPDGKPWRTVMKQAHYGYIRSVDKGGTYFSPKGHDKEHLDIFVKPGTPEDYTGPVFVVDQVKPDTGKFDEVKIMLGFENAEEARQGYLANYTPDWKGLGNLTPTTLPALKLWLRFGRTGHSFSKDPKRLWRQAGTQPTKAVAPQQPKPAALTEAPTPAERAGAVPAIEPLETTQEGAGRIAEVPVSQLTLAPERFQYKVQRGQKGETGSLAGVKTFDPNLAGIVQVWRDPQDGQIYVVNGHNRVALAQQQGTERIAVRYLDVANEQEARQVGALTNIAEGRGTAVDSAKLFRERGLSREDLEAEGIPMRERIATEGLALANLDPGLFNRVVKGELAEEQAAIIGERIRDHAQQRALVQLIEEQAKKGKAVTKAVVRELADMVEQAPTTDETQATLFGEETQSRSLALERAKLAADLRQRLSHDKRLFGVVSRAKNIEELRRAGNVIRGEESQAISEQAGVTLALFDRLKNSTGRISDLLNQAVKRIQGGEHAQAVRTETYQQLLDAIPAVLRGERLEDARPPGAQAGVRAQEPPAGPEAPPSGVAEREDSYQPPEAPTPAEEGTSAIERATARLADALNAAADRLQGQTEIPVPPPTIGARPIIGREATPEEAPLFSRAAQEAEPEQGALPMEEEPPISVAESSTVRETPDSGPQTALVPGRVALQSATRAQLRDWTERGIIVPITRAEAERRRDEFIQGTPGPQAAVFRSKGPHPSGREGWYRIVGRPHRPVPYAPPARRVAQRQPPAPVSPDREIGAAPAPPPERVRFRPALPEPPASREAALRLRELNRQMERQEGIRDAFRLSTLGDPEIIRTFKEVFNVTLVPVAPTREASGDFLGMQHGGTLFVNAEQERHGFVQLAGHELLHHISKTEPELYAYFKTQAADYLASGAIPRYAERLAAKGDQKGAGRGGADYVFEEILADFTGDAFADPVFLEGLAFKNPSKFERLMAAVRRWLDRVAGKLQRLGFGSAEYVQDVDGLQSYLVNVLDAYRDHGPEGIGDVEPVKFARGRQEEPAYEPEPAPPARPAAIPYTVDQPDYMDTVRRRFEDQMIDVRRLRDAVKEQVGELADELDPVLHEELYQGRAAKQVQDFLTDELKPLLDTMHLNKTDMATLDRYLHARHAREANEYLASINEDMDDNEALSGMTNEEADRLLAEADTAKLDRLAARADNILERSRQMLVAYGLESQETIDAWKARYQYYVPLHREGFEEEGTPQGPGRSVRGRHAKERLGSKRAVVDILANVAMDRERIIARGEKMKPTIALAGLLMRYPNASIATLAKPAPLTYTNPETGLSETVPGDLGEYKVPRVRFLNKRTGQVEWRPDPSYQSRENVVNFRVNGIDYAIVFNEQNPRAAQMARALKAMDVPRMRGIMAAIQPATQFLAKMRTQYSPIFGVVNLVRDTGFSMLTLSSTPLAGQQRKVASYIFESLRGIYADARAVRRGEHPTSRIAQTWEHFQRVGGPTGYRQLFQTSDQRAKEIQKVLNPTRLQQGWQRAGGEAIFNWLSDYNLTMENAIRLAVFRAGLEQGLSDKRAASLAKNITVNFNKKGTLSTHMGALYMFFNANIQGTARIAETLFKKGVYGKLSSTGKKIVLGGVTLGAMQAIALALAGYDDDEIPDWVKDRNLVIPIMTAEKGYISIPYPLGFNILPAFGRLATEALIYGKPVDKILQFTEALIDAFDPMGGSPDLLQEITPAVGDPLVQLATNKDWTGRPIYLEDFSRLQPTPGHARARYTATPWAKWLASAINWATGGDEYEPGRLSPTPDQIDYLVSYATGSVGKEIGKAAQTATSMVTGEELPTYRIPGAGRFYGEAAGGPAIRERYYENLRQLNIYERAIKERRKDGIHPESYIREHPQAKLWSYGNLMERQVQALTRRKRKLLEREAPREQVRQIEEQITRLMQRLNERVEDAEQPERR